MPEVKLNSKNPFHLKFTDPEIDAVQISIYIYSGVKDTDKGQPKFQLYKNKIPGTNDVIFEIGDLVKDYLNPTIQTPLNSNIDYVKWVQIESKIISDKPEVEDITVITETNVGKNITLRGSDVQFRPLTYNIASGPSNGTATLSGRVVAYVPNLNFSGTDTFTYTANNGVKDSDPATVTVKVLTADNWWINTGSVKYGTSLSDARQSVIDDVNPVRPDILTGVDEYYHLGYSAYPPYNITEIGLIDIGRAHWKRISGTPLVGSNPIPDGFYGMYFWSDYSTNTNHQEIATWQIVGGLVSKVFIYSS